MAGARPASANDRRTTPFSKIAIEIEIIPPSLHTITCSPDAPPAALQLSAAKNYCQFCTREKEFLLYSQIEKKH
jgi:hypothetical protein